MERVFPYPFPIAINPEICAAMRTSEMKDKFIE